MKPGAGKRKGSGFERIVAKILSNWWTNGEDPNVFYRSQSSGARGKFNKNVLNSYADISTLKPEGFPLLEVCVIECKMGYSKKHAAGCKERWDILSIIDGNANNHVFTGFLNEIFEDAELASESAKHKIEPILIARRDGRKDIICLRIKFYNKLREWSGNKLDNLDSLIMNTEKFVNENKIIIFNLEQFLNTVDPQIFIGISNDLRLSK